MYAAVLLVATAAVGVDTGWRPAVDDPQSVQYIIQIEPAVVAKMLRDGTPIDSIVPPDVPGGVIRCFRVQMGEEELPRVLPEVAKAAYETPVEDSATLRKVEAMELSPAPTSSTASTATPPVNALAADMPQPRYSNTLSGSGAPSYPNGAAVGGTPLNPVRTANAADTNPALGGTSGNFSIPGGSTTTPVAPSSPSRFNTTPLPASSSSSSTTYQNSGGYSSTPINNAGSEYPAYSPPPLNNNGSNLNNGQTSQPGGNSSSDTNFQRYGDTYANPNSSTIGQNGNYNNGQGYSAIPNNNNSANNNGTYNSGGLTPINSTPSNQNSQNNNSNPNNNGNMVPPSNQQQPNPNYQQQPAPNYQQPYPQQQPFPYGQPGYVATPPYAPPTNPYYAAPGYTAPYSPYVAALPPYAAPPAQQTPPPATTPATTPTPSPSDRPARDRELDEEKSKIVVAPVERPYWMLVIVAFLSLGFNIYMGWMVVDFRTKYRDILAGFRELKAAN